MHLRQTTQQNEAISELAELYKAAKEYYRQRKEGIRQGRYRSVPSLNEEERKERLTFLQNQEEKIRLLFSHDVGFENIDERIVANLWSILKYYGYNKANNTDPNAFSVKLPQDIRERLLEETEQVINRFEGQHVANVIASWGELELDWYAIQPTLRCQLLQAILDKQDDIFSESISHILLGLGKLLKSVPNKDLRSELDKKLYHDLRHQLISATEDNCANGAITTPQMLETLSAYRMLSMHWGNPLRNHEAVNLLKEIKTNIADMSPDLFAWMLEELHFFFKQQRIPADLHEEIKLFIKDKNNLGNDQQANRIEAALVELHIQPTPRPKPTKPAPTVSAERLTVSNKFAMLMPELQKEKKQQKQKKIEKKIEKIEEVVARQSLAQSAIATRACIKQKNQPLLLRVSNQCSFFKPIMDFEEGLIRGAAAGMLLHGLASAIPAASPEILYFIGLGAMIGGYLGINYREPEPASTVRMLLK